MTQQITGELYKKMIANATAAIENHKQEINELNVFPVPDGDTGTNMSLTISAAEKTLAAMTPGTLGQTADAVASALLRGARGNSGVILSLLFRGFAKRLKDVDSADAVTFASALASGVDSAYKAVMKPAEGTILTVSRLAAGAAAEAAETESDIEAVLEQALAVGYEALADTINQNPVLKKAGVIDAGAKGYLYILDGMFKALRGIVIEKKSPKDDEGEKADFTQFTAEDIKFAYCTEFIAEKRSKADTNRLRDFLNNRGDSIVVVDDDEIIKVHVHTNAPGVVLTEALTHGPLLSIKVENMHEQHSEVSITSAEYAMPEPSRPPKPDEPTGTGKPQGTRKSPGSWEPTASEDSFAPVKQAVSKKPQTHGERTASSESLIPGKPTVSEDMKEFGTVVVCAGAGIEAVFRDLGADRIITGGQTMNPSTEDILEKINETPSETVFVLPNNKNIIMAAQQCIPLTDKRVIVIPTRSIPQGVSAMLAIEGADDIEKRAACMSEAAKRVHTALITRAARDSTFDGLNILKDEYLALIEDSLAATGQDAGTVIGEVAAALSGFSPEFITIFAGEGISGDEAATVAGRIGALSSGAEISVIHGDQPVYHYIISAE